MQIEEKIRIQATPEHVFPFYENVSSWSSWDPDVQSSSIDGEFITGAKGRLKPVKGPEAKIEFTEITKNQSFTTISKLPLCTSLFNQVKQLKFLIRLYFQDFSPLYLAA